jgi:hypothetical protein
MHPPGSAPCACVCAFCAARCRSRFPGRLPVPQLLKEGGGYVPEMVGRVPPLANSALGKGQYAEPEVLLADALAAISHLVASLVKNILSTALKTGHCLGPKGSKGVKTGVKVQVQKHSKQRRRAGRMIGGAEAGVDLIFNLHKSYGEGATGNCGGRLAAEGRTRRWWQGAR